MNEQNVTTQTVQLRTRLEGQHTRISQQLCHRSMTINAPHATSISMAAVLGSILLSVMGAQHPYHHAAGWSRPLPPVNGGQ